MTKFSTKSIAFILAFSVLFSSCASTTLIQSHPAGAKLYIDGQPVGVTPYTYSDTKIVGSVTDLRIEKEGYETLQIPLIRNEKADVGAIVGGLFFLVPFLWTMEYNPTHTYELSPLKNHDNIVKSAVDTTVKSKEERLKELKNLLDSNLITKEDYEKAKKEILEEK